MSPLAYHHRHQETLATKHPARFLQSQHVTMLFTHLSHPSAIAGLLQLIACDGVYQPRTGPARINHSLWAQEAMPPHPGWACFSWKQDIKRSSSAQSALTEEESRCMLQAPARKPPGFQTADAKSTIRPQSTMEIEGDTWPLSQGKQLDLGSRIGSSPGNAFVEIET